MEIGTILNIQIEGSQSRLTGELIGVREGKYLIIKIPPLKSMSHITNLLYKGNPITIRYMHAGTIFGLRSRINNVIHNPERLVFIEYPEKIENHDLRAHKRIDCFLPANVRVADTIIDGAIKDISISGCRFSAKNSKVEYSVVLQVGNEIDVRFQLPGVEKKLNVKGTQQLTVKGIQKHNTKAHDTVNIGIKFKNMNIEAQERLYAFLSAVEA
jgi:hypothetical protein